MRLPPGAAIGAATLLLLVPGCGATSGGGHGDAAAARALQDYVRRIEPPRLAVNRLLKGADPILGAYRRHRISAPVAQTRLRRLERRFAAYGARVGAIDASAVPGLRAAHAGYAHSYVLEDRYLRALVAALPRRRYDRLPRTARIQRAAIVRWRVRLFALARRAGVRLSADLEIAGRGEIAPSPEGD
ncbi:MAG TPA: hypothetical protein VIM22_03345 [Solirubrobacteraceae bacterium]|jgi:hypothetical protein